VPERPSEETTSLTKTRLASRSAQPRIGATRTDIRGELPRPLNPLASRSAAHACSKPGQIGVLASAGAVCERSGRASLAAWKEFEQAEADRPDRDGESWESCRAEPRSSGPTPVLKTPRRDHARRASGAESSRSGTMPSDLPPSACRRRYGKRSRRKHRPHRAPGGLAD
jgi:hypothetical protein